MSTHLRHTLVSAGFSVVVAACAHQANPGPGVATTTRAVTSNNAAVLQVAKARCRRLAECNRLGNGHMFADEPQCLEGYRDKDADLQILRTCSSGVDKGRLDICIAALASQYCDASMGPVTAMPDCGSYCAHEEKLLVLGSAPIDP
jgi:hypothetical protein